MQSKIRYDLLGEMMMNKLLAIKIVYLKPIIILVHDFQKYIKQFLLFMKHKKHPP